MPLSQTPTAIQQRISRLPRLVIALMEARAKKDAVGFERTFREGIQGNLLRLKPLKPATVAAKERQGFSWPEYPLVGEGADDERSYSNMMQIKKLNDRWVVKPRAGMHHGGTISLKDLFDVHEYGATIVNGFGKGILIRIPPRSAARQAFRGYMRQRVAKDPSSKVRAAIARFVQEGDAATLERIRRKYAEGTARIAEARGI